MNSTFLTFILLLRVLPGTANVAFSSDGTGLLVGGVDFQFLEVGSRACRWRLKRAIGETFPTPISLSEAGDIIALCDTRKTVKFVRSDSGEQLASCETGYRSRNVSMCLSPDAAFLATALFNGEYHNRDLRRIRVQLAAMNLDWDMPAMPPPAEPPLKPANGPGDPAADLPKIMSNLEAGDWVSRRAARLALARLAIGHGEAVRRLLEKADPERGPEARAAVAWQLRLFRKPELAKYADVLTAIDCLGIGDVADKTYIVFNTGESITLDADSPIVFDYARGWLIAETPEKILLLDTDLLRTEIPRRRELPADWEKKKDKHRADKPLPGELRAIDWNGFCDQIIADGLSVRPFTQAVICAYWCLCRGDDERALKLLALAEGQVMAEEKESKKSGDSKKAGEPAGDSSLLRQVSENFYKTYQHFAITGAHRGKPRRAIIEYWRIAATFCMRNRSSLPVRDNMMWEFDPWGMVESYESLLAEDHDWRDPGEEEIAKLSVDDQARYWIHRLRDLAARQFMQPGGVSILGDFAGLDEKNNPAEQLRLLGWAAVPFLIEHFEDQRPTRSMGYWRDFAPESYYLLDYARCCQEILGAIAGHCPNDKKAAEAWWREKGKLGAEGYYLELLKSDNPAVRGQGAWKLLEANRTKHLPGLLDIVRKETPDGAPGVFDAIVGYLGKEHEAFLEECLSAKNFKHVYQSALALWTRCGSAKGAREVNRRAREPGSKLGDLDFTFFSLLAQIPEDFVVDTFCEFAGHPDAAVRRAALEHAGRVADRRLLDALVPILDDKSSTGAFSGYEIRWADMAAAAIRAMLGLKDDPEAGDESAAVRDRSIESLKKLVRSSIDSLNWNQLRRRALKGF